jgi:monovalent cation:H+ antiporter-2, CPA2 family
VADAVLGTVKTDRFGKPLAAFIVVMLLRRPVRSALSISVALAHIGEFSFILAALATSLNILPSEATNALVVASVASIILNPLAALMGRRGPHHTLHGSRAKRS